MANAPKPPFVIIGHSSHLANGLATSSATRNENPGALAGATGADVHSTSFVPVEYRKRAEAATSLCMAIGNCYPQDACQLMEAALLDLGAGQPFPPLFSVMEAANDWAAWAVVAELKAYALACYNHLPPTDQSAFLAYLGRAA